MTTPSSAAVPLGIILASFLALLVFVMEGTLLSTIVFTTYHGLVDSSASATFFEVAWLLATLDWLLNLSSLLSLVLWCSLVVLSILVFRQLSSSIKMITTALLLIGGAWLIFAYKYAALGGFDLSFFMSFLIWRLLVAVLLLVPLTGVLSLPFWFAKRRHSELDDSLVVIQFSCRKCGAEYRSIPLICTNCGAEGEILEQR